MTEKLTVTIPDVPIDTVRAWATQHSYSTRGVQDAARAALAEWEAQQKPKYTVEYVDYGRWLVMKGGGIEAARFLDDLLPNAGGEAQALCDRLNGETNG